MAAFWFHYNKPLSKQRGYPTMTVHCQGACHFVRHIECHVPVRTRERKSQPHVVMAGSGTVCFSGETAYITDGRCSSITQAVRSASR
jgi:hypothetical protein